MVIRRLAVSLCALGVMSCGHTIGYTLPDTYKTDAAPIDKVLRINAVVDKATFNSSSKVIRDGVSSRGISAAGYRDGTVGPGVTAMLVKHFQFAGHFKAVLGPDDAAEADLDLSVELVEFDSLISLAPTAGADGGAFGLMGNVSAASRAQTRAMRRVRVEFSNATVRDRSGQVLATETASAKDDKEVSAAEREGEQVYVNADNTLREAIAQLADKLAKSLGPSKP